MGEIVSGVDRPGETEEQRRERVEANRAEFAAEPLAAVSAPIAEPGRATCLPSDMLRRADFTVNPDLRLSTHRVTI